MTDVPAPDLTAAPAGDSSSVSYRLSDISAHAVALPGALGLEKAHIVDVHAGRLHRRCPSSIQSEVRTPTTMVSTTGNPVSRAGLAGGAARRVRRAAGCDTR